MGGEDMCKAHVVEHDNFTQLGAESDIARKKVGQEVTRLAVHRRWRGREAAVCLLQLHLGHLGVAGRLAGRLACWQSFNTFSIICILTQTTFNTK